MKPSRNERRYAHAVGAAARSQRWSSTFGGGSDGNFTGALGIPTLDGLGAVGAGVHTLEEHVLISELAPRARLFAGLLAGLEGDDR